MGRKHFCVKTSFQGADGSEAVSAGEWFCLASLGHEIEYRYRASVKGKPKITVFGVPTLGAKLLQVGSVESECSRLLTAAPVSASDLHRFDWPQMEPGDELRVTFCDLANPKLGHRGER